MILCQFLFSELKAPLFIYLFKFFLNIHGFVGSVQSRGFRLEGETIYEGDMRRGMEEVFAYAGFFWVSLSCMKIDTKMNAWKNRDEEVMHDD